MTSLPYRPSLPAFGSASDTVSRTAKTCADGAGEIETLWMPRGMNALSFSESFVSCQCASGHTLALTFLQTADTAY